MMVAQRAGGVGPCQKSSRTNRGKTSNAVSKLLFFVVCPEATVMDLALWIYPLLFLAALAAGLIDAIAGGGGLIALPALLMAGFPVPLALGTNKLQSLFGSSMAAVHYARHGVIDGRRCWLGCSGASPRQVSVISTSVFSCWSVRLVFSGSLAISVIFWRPVHEYA